jgi:hypothetical protein
METKMNELIRKFERESHIDVYGLGKDRIKWEETLEKFAKMIICECADLFPMTFTDEQYQRRIDKTIRKHFGVDQ